MLAVEAEAETAPRQLSRRRSCGGSWVGSTAWIVRQASDLQVRGSNPLRLEETFLPRKAQRFHQKIEYPSRRTD